MELRLSPSPSAVIIPALLSGGAGSRLWPLSRERFPKQLLPLLGERTLLQEALRRVSDRSRYAAPIVVGNEELRFVLAEQVRQEAQGPVTIALEPLGRNTAAATAAAALLAAREHPDGLLLVLPADQLVRDLSAFHAAVDAAVREALAGRLVAFGAVGEGTSEGAIGGSGMYLLPIVPFLRELEARAPAVLSAVAASVSAGRTDLDFFRLDPMAFALAPALSLDEAVLDDNPLSRRQPPVPGCRAVGSWASLWEEGDKDADGNVVLGDALAMDSRGSYVRSEDRLTAVIGVDDLVVITTEDAVLVAPRARADEVRQVALELKGRGRGEVEQHPKVHRPWGTYQGLHGGERHQVKCLTIKPGARISLQRHFHRAEHWVVVKGTALVTRGEEQSLVYENQSIYIPMGTLHRLENPGRVPLEIIEVQSGSYLGEDDIVRVDDAYGRS